MKYMTDGTDFYHIEAEKYWSFPKTYKGDKRFEINNMIFSGDYLGSEKIDGSYYRYYRDEDGNCYLIARSENVKGEMTDKIEWVPQLTPFFNALPNGTCLLGEIHKKENSASRKITTIMGCLKDKAIERQKNDPLYYYVFDVWAWNGKSLLNTPARERFKLLSQIEKDFCGAQYVRFAHYYTGQALWDELIRVQDAGGEGVVITKAESHPEPGKRTARKTLKIKKELDNPIDCFLTGRYKPSTMLYKGDNIENWQYWYNEKTGTRILGNKYEDYANGVSIYPTTKGFYYNWASAVEIGVYKDGEVYPVGWISGITEEVKAGIVANPEDWKGRVVSINAMEIEPDTLCLRHGKIIEWRTDKKAEDCEFSQLG